MKRFLCIAVAGLAACWASVAAESPPTSRDRPVAPAAYQDIVYFAESRPILFRLHLTVDGKPLSALWEEYVTKVFKYLDTNGDGFLDKNEVKGVPSPDVLFGAGFGGGTPTMDQLDTNGDGKVSRDELAAYYRRLGATPFQVASGGRRSDIEDQLIELNLVIDELEGDGQVFIVGNGGRRGGDTNAVNEALFKLLDTTGDGKLTQEKLAAAAAVLLKRDRNDDEMITPDEILPGAGRNGGGNGLAIVFASRLGDDFNRQRNRGVPAPSGW